MPPAGGPGGGVANRTPLFVVLGILAAAALVGLYFLVSGGDDNKDPQNPNEPSTQAPNTSPSSTPSTEGPEQPTNDGPVKLLESGFTNFTDSLDEPTAAYGFVVHNTGDDILQGLAIQVVAYAADDKVITTQDYTIGTIRPDEKLGLGGELWGEDMQGGLERLEIQIGDASDSVTDPSEVPDGAFTIGEPTTKADDYNLTTTFELSWTYAAELDIYPTAYAIFRDAAGNIVGASRGGASGVDGATNTVVELTTYDVIPDVESTEVYVEPGYVYVP
jgi:hypothetical protein